MSAKVSDMIKMYNHQPALKPPGDKPATTRKWPTVSTPGGPGNKPPPVAPKPKPLTPHANGSATQGRNIGPKPFGSTASTPQWKLDMQRNSSDTGDQKTNVPPWMRRQQEKEEEKPEPSIPPWRQRQIEKDEKSNQESIPAWKQRLNKAAEEQGGHSKEETIPAWKRNLNKASEEKSHDDPPWKQRQEKRDQENGPASDDTIPAWKRNLQQRSHQDSHSTPSWMDRNKDSNTQMNGINKTGSLPRPTAPNKPGFLNRRNGGEDEAQNNLAPSRGTQQSRSFTYNTMPKPDKLPASLGSSSSQKSSSDQSDSTPNSPKIRSSFLHTSVKGPSPQNTTDRPARTPTPPSADKPRAKGLPKKLPLPREVFSMPPPIKTSKPASVTLPRRSKKKSSPLPPPPIAVSGPSNAFRPLPTPGSRNLPGPPDLPGRLRPSSPAKSRGLPAPPMENHAHGRPLPSPVAKKDLPLPPPPMETDDIYDDPGEEPPPPPISSMPPPLKKQESSGMIPTWEDEDDEAEALYDETPDELPSQNRPPPLPVGFPVPGSTPIPPDDGEEMYEDVEEYMRLKRLHAANANSNDNKKDKEKKKKDSDKKEKDLRKKFKLGKGEIVPEGHGVVKENCRGGWGKDLAVSAGENIDIIRMTDNPRGKWLIRNAEGSFGYVDSDKVEINLQELRSTFGVGNKGYPGMSAGPPVPPIPTDTEAIYDQTADEDLYEEF